MEARADDPVAELSAGMTQRIAACVATLHEPELLLLDEPDSNLDAEARETWTAWSRRCSTTRPAD
jgi:ABC-type multidrug transport system ATPase subunit